MRRLAAAPRSVLIFALLTACLGIFVGLRFEFSTDISEFLPAGEDREVAELSVAVARSELSRTLIVSLQAADAEQAIEAGRLFEQQLRAQPDWQLHFSFIEGGPPQQLEASLWGMYQPQRLGFAARDVASAKQLVSDAGLLSAVKQLKLQLASPLSMLVGRAAPNDPFLAVPGLLRRLQSQERNLQVVDGRYLAQGSYAIVMLGSHKSAFDADAQIPVLARVEQARIAVEKRLPGTLFESSGLARFSVSAARSIQSDIARISLLSALSLGAMCLLLFRSLRLVLLTMLPVGFGMLSGVAALLALEGKVHGLTLAFGASLIGVCVDYVIHFYVHHLHSDSGQSPHTTMRGIAPGLLLGAGTTVVGFLVLAGSNFPGLGQAAIFGAVGVSAALAITFWLLPAVMPRQVTEVPLRAALGCQLERGVRRLATCRRGVLVVAAGVVLFCLWGAQSLHWDDQMAGLMRFDSKLQGQSERVRNRVASFEQSRFVIAVGATDEQALQVNDELTRVLQQAVGSQQLQNYQGLGQLLPSSQLQSQISTVLREANLSMRLPPVLEQEGFDSSVFAPFFRHLTETAAAPLQWTDWQNSPVAALVRPFRIELGDRVGLVTFLRGVSEPAALRDRIDNIPGATFLDQSALMQGANAGYRRRVVGLLGLGLLGVLALLWFRYRSVAPTLAAFVPAVLACAVTVSLLSLLGVALNLLGLTALLMVLSIGVDYGVFLTETQRHLVNSPEQSSPGTSSGLAATLTGLLVACLSTVFGFGILALSSHPALNTIGLIAAIGVTSSLLLAPLALVFLPANRASLSA